MKKGSLALATIMVAILAGCSNSTAVDTSESISVPEKEAQEETLASEANSDGISASDFEISVDAKTGDDGKQTLMFSYTNHSKYPIAEFDYSTKFGDPSTYTENEKALLSKLASECQFSDVSELYADKLIGVDRSYTEPGQTSNGAAIAVNAVYQIDDYDYYELSEPAIWQIVYLKGESLYIAYIDFDSNGKIGTMELGPARAWFSSEAASAVPQPDAQIVNVTGDTDAYSFAYAYPFDVTNFQDYINACKEAGYTHIQYEQSDYYSATNDAGVTLMLAIDAEQNMLAITVSNN